MKHNDDFNAKVSNIFGSDPPPRKPGAQGCGAPEYFISRSVLEAYPEDGFAIKDTAHNFLFPKVQFTIDGLK